MPVSLPIIYNAPCLDASPTHPHVPHLRSEHEANGTWRRSGGYDLTHLGETTTCPKNPYGLCKGRGRTRFPNPICWFGLGFGDAGFPDTSDFSD